MHHDQCLPRQRQDFETKNISFSAIRRKISTYFHSENRGGGNGYGRRAAPVVAGRSAASENPCRQRSAGSRAKRRFFVVKIRGRRTRGAWTSVRLRVVPRKRPEGGSWRRG